MHKFLHTSLVKFLPIVYVCNKGLFIYYVINRGGEGVSQNITNDNHGVRGVSQNITANESARGVSQNITYNEGGSEVLLSQIV